MFVGLVIRMVLDLRIIGLNILRFVCWSVVFVFMMLVIVLVMFSCMVDFMVLLRGIRLMVMLC